MLEVERIQWPVGQGGFHSCSISFRDFDEMESQGYHYVYDCGSKPKGHFRSTLLHFRHEQIDTLFISHIDDDHINGAADFLRRCRVRKVVLPLLTPTISMMLLLGEVGSLSRVFRTFLIDPIGWLSERGANEIVFVRPDNYIDDFDESLFGAKGPDPIITPGQLNDGLQGVQIIDSGHSIRLENTKSQYVWLLKPFVPACDTRDLLQFQENVKSEFGFTRLGQPELKEICSFDTTQLKELRALFDRLPSKKKLNSTRNYYSLCLFSGPAMNPVMWKSTDRLCLYNSACCHTTQRVPSFDAWEIKCEACSGSIHANIAGWLAFGEIEMNNQDVREEFETTYAQEIGNIGSIIVPHHGAKGNFHGSIAMLPSLQHAICCAGRTNSYGHPRWEVVEAFVQNNKSFHVVNEECCSMIRERLWS